MPHVIQDVSAPPPAPTGLARLLIARSVGHSLFLLKEGKACIDDTVIGPVLAVWVFLIGDESCPGGEQR